MSKLEFHVHHTQIIVSMPYTCFRMTYQASLEAPRLVELPFWTRAHQRRTCRVGC
jgi:hypothetical protein